MWAWCWGEVGGCGRGERAEINSPSAPRAPPVPPSRLPLPLLVPARPPHGHRRRQNHPFRRTEAIDASVLETFEYAGPDQQIVTETREFSAVCPYSGLPDFATLTIKLHPV